jgi:type I restriction enzyme M protein
MPRSRRPAPGPKPIPPAKSQPVPAAPPAESSRADLRSAIRQARRTLRKDLGISTDIERLPLLTWLMFLKFLDDHEAVAETTAVLRGAAYTPLLAAPYRWRDWAAGEKGLTGIDLLKFITQDRALRPDGKEGPGLLATLRALPLSGRDDRRRVIRQVFEGCTCGLTSGSVLRDVCALIDSLHFTSRDDVHTLSLLYEDMLREMRDAAGQNGEFYTPRPVIRFCIDALDPRLGETFIDNACGTGGFVVAAWEKLKPQAHHARDLELLGTTVRGAEPKPLPFLLVQMNLLLHGMDGVRVERANAFARKLADYGPADEVDIIGTNVPFGAEVTREDLSAFPPDRQTSDSALLFLQVIMARLRRTPSPAGRPARAAIIVPNGVLSELGTAAAIKRDLLTEFRLRAVIRLPEGVFAPYTDIPTNILFLEASGPTEEIWFYHIPTPADRAKFGKTQPIETAHLDPVLAWFKAPVENDHAWVVKWGDEHRAADTAAAPHRAVAQAAAEEARAHARTLRDLKVADAKPEKLAAAEAAVKDAEARAKAAQDQADALYWPVFDIDHKIPRSKSGTVRVAPEKTAARMSDRTRSLVETLSSLQKDLSLGYEGVVEPVHFSELLTRRALDVEVDPDSDYSFAGVYSFGRGMFRREPKRGSEFSYKQLTRVRTGDFCYPKLMAWEGAFAVVPPECDGCVVSPEFPVFTINTVRVLPEVLEAYFRLPETWETLAGSSSGTNLRRRRLNPATLLAAAMPLPPMPQQLRFRQVVEKLRAAETELGHIESDLAALLPSALAQVFGG